MATESIECPDCGAEISSEEHVHVDEVPEIETPEKSRDGYQFGPGRTDVWRCKGCGAILGVRQR